MPLRISLGGYVYHVLNRGKAGRPFSDIVCVKAREAGFNGVVCRDLFIHHFGTRTFAHGAPKSAG
jgi:hypothetical protein